MELKRVLESLLFANGKPLTLKELRGILKDAAEFEPTEHTAALKDASPEDITAALEELTQELDGQRHPYTVQHVGETWQMVSRPEFGPWIKQLFDQYRPQRLSQSALETLAIIAYRQPITRADIEAIRGVQVDTMVQTLLERGLVKIAGRAELPGRPMLLETTQTFLEHFGLKSLDDLPNAAELRQVKLPSAPVPEVSSGADPSQPELPQVADGAEAATPVAEMDTAPTESPAEPSPAEPVSAEAGDGETERPAEG